MMKNLRKMERLNICKIKIKGKKKLVNEGEIKGERVLNYLKY